MVERGGGPDPHGAVVLGSGTRTRVVNKDTASSQSGVITAAALMPGIKFEFRHKTNNQPRV